MVMAALVAIGGCEKKKADIPLTPDAAPSPSSKIATAPDVAQALKVAGLPVVGVVKVTEESDDNHLLGRPGQYQSKVFFFDARHPKSVVEGDEQGENTIEVFPTAVGAQNRRDYIAQISGGIPALAQYQYLRGKALIRLDHIMLPSEAKHYEAALSKMTIG